MWFLRSIDGSVRYLNDKNKYAVGRKNTDIVISNDDSISRTHAVIEIENNDVYVTDNGSKYGTYIGERQLQKNEKNKLDDSVEVKFGLLHTIFKLEKLDMKIVTSNIKGNDRQTLYNSLEFLKATRVSNWTNTCTHLVVSDLILTIKVLCALIEEQPIVNVKYFIDFVTSVKNNTPPPDHKKYLPDLNEALLHKNIKLEYKPERKTLFERKIFVFLTEKARMQISELITLTGGKTIAWEKTKIDNTKLESDSSEYLFIEEPLDGVDQKSHMYVTFKDAVTCLSQQNKRSIPFQEIALAVVHCSCREHCNPMFNRIALLIPGNTQQADSENILAYDTQHNSEEAMNVDQPQSSETISLQSDDEPVRISVPPSYETDLETMVLSGPSSSSIKRPVDSQSWCSASKRVKEDQPNTSADFAFKKPSSQSSATSKTSMFSFPKTKTASIVITNTVAQDQEILVENPFSRKRKATKEIGAVAKKTPLENISNTTVNRKPEEKNPKDFLSSTLVAQNTSYNFCKDVSCITKSTNWLNNSSGHGEIKVEENISDNPIDPEKELIMKRNKEFKNSIVIEFIDLTVKRREVSNVTVSDKSSNKSLKNFKKFKKVLLEIQSEIISESAMEKFVVGNQTNYNYLDDVDNENENEDDDDEFATRLQPVAALRATKTKRKFLFAA